MSLLYDAACIWAQANKMIVSLSETKDHAELHSFFFPSKDNTELLGKRTFRMIRVREFVCFHLYFRVCSYTLKMSPCVFHAEFLLHAIGKLKNSILAPKNHLKTPKGSPKMAPRAPKIFLRCHLKGEGQLCAKADHSQLSKCGISGWGWLVAGWLVDWLAGWLRLAGTWHVWCGCWWQALAD